MVKAQHVNQKRRSAFLFNSLFFLLLLFSFSLHGQVIITEVSANGEVELKNIGASNANIGTYWLCNFPAYELISDLTFTCGSTVIEPGKVAVVKTSDLGITAASGEVGLYTNSTFTSAAGLIDYVEWGNAGHTRAVLAIGKGIWTQGSFVPAFNSGQSIQTTVNASAATDWKIATPTLCDLVAAPNVNLAQNAKFGAVLTDSTGRTLYFFTRDAKKDTSFCNGTCATTWPIFYREKISPAAGLKASDFGTITRADGKKQSTYKGWPLHIYSGDAELGDSNGEGIGTFWYVAKPDYKVMIMDGNLKGLDGITYTSKYVPGTERVKYLVDAYGRTLYTFTRDSLLKNKFTNSTFSNNGIWPIYNDTLTKFPSGISDTLFKLTTVFGRQQLTFKGWPLYQYSQDSVRGHTKGITVGAVGRWPVASPTLGFAPSATTAVQEAFRDKLSLRLSPVPANESLLLEVNSEIAGEAVGTLYNLNGQAMKQFNFRLYEGKNQSRVDVSSLAKGLYLLSLTIDGQPAAYEKIIKY